MIKPQGILRPEHTGDFLSDIAEHGSDDYRTGDDLSDQVIVKMQQAGDADIIKEDDEADGYLAVEEGNSDEAADESDHSDEVFGVEDTSFDSYGNPTSSRVINGSLKGYRYPDFIIVKATTSLTNDTILLIVEVKKNGNSITTSRLQIQEYLRMAAPKRRVRLLQGLLVMGPTTESFFLVSGAHDAAVVPGPSFHTTGQNLQTHIHTIAAQNW